MTYRCFLSILGLLVGLILSAIITATATATASATADNGQNDTAITTTVTTDDRQEEDLGNRETPVTFADPEQAVEYLQSALLAVMRDAEALGYQGRFQQLAPVIQATHDLTTIARVTVGRHWDQLGEQRNRFLALFEQLSIATYAHRFDGYSGQVFKVISTEQTEPGNAIVRTFLTNAAGDKVALDYLLDSQPQGWQIINVIFKGISDLALKRAEYTSVIRRQGTSELLAKLEAQIAEYEK